jgi:hypothetical protein
MLLIQRLLVLGDTRGVSWHEQGTQTQAVLQAVHEPHAGPCYDVCITLKQHITPPIITV